MNRKLIKDLMDAIKASDRKKTSGYDTSAVVRRIEDGTAWVHIPGGVDETPVKLTINASVGDTVQVRVSGGRAFLVGNRTAPPTDDTTAIKATYVAKNAQETAVEAKSEASEAWHYAGTAKEAAESAQDSADSAAEAAIEAWNHADDAHQAAVSANNSANNALVQLSVVEDVAGTLRWISEHGSYVPTTDTTVIEGSVYFIYENGDYIPIANPDPGLNPSQEGWYILDVTKSQSDYILAHLAVTSAGLWVLPFDFLAEHPLVDSDGYNLVDSDNNLLVDFSKDPQNASGYKVLLSSDGMTVFNSEGTAVANYGATTTIGSALLRNVHIDNEAVYIRNGDKVLAKYGDTIELGENQDIMIGTSSNTTIQEGYYVLNSSFAFQPAHTISSVSSISICGRDSSTNEYYKDYIISSADYTVNGNTITINSPISGTSIVPDMAMVTYLTSDKITQLRIGKNGTTAANYPIVIGNNNEEIDPSNVFSVSWTGSIRTKGKIYLDGSSDYLGYITNYSGITGTHIYAGIDSFLEWAYMSLSEGTYVIEAEFDYIGTASSNTGCVSLRICVGSRPSASNIVASTRVFANANSNLHVKVSRTAIIKLSERSTVCLVPSSHYEGTVSGVIFRAIRVS